MGGGGLATGVYCTGFISSPKHTHQVASTSLRLLNNIPLEGFWLTFLIPN